MKVSPFTYTDFRKFLSDFLKESGITYIQVCEALSIKSPGHLSLILKGKANISGDQIPKFASFCNLKKRETEFFTTMVQFNQEKNNQRKFEYFESLISFREASIYRVGSHLYKYYDAWYHSVIRALLEFVDENESALTVAKLVVPAIRADQAKRSIKLMLELGLIEKDARGFLRPTQKSIDSGSTETSVMVNNFVLSMLDRGREAMDRFEREERMFSCVTLGVNKEGYDEIVAELREFRKKVAEIAQKNPADRVVQVNFQLFPVSKCKDVSDCKDNKL